MASGCRSVYPRAMAPQTMTVGTSGAADAGSLPVDEGIMPPSIWPSRWGAAAMVPGAAAGVIKELEHPASELAPAHLSRFHRLRTGETEYADMAALAQGLGVVDSYKFQAEGPGCYLFVHQPPVDGADDKKTDTAKKNKDGEPELAFKFISAQLDGIVQGGQGSEDQLQLERTWFTYRVPRGEKEPIGTILLMPGMFGTPEPVIDGVEKYFRSKGWSVLRMLSHPSRFTERMRFGLEDGAEAKVAQQIAEMFDTRAAEAAYAASAAMRFVHERFSDNADKPVVLLGMSGGAMILPSVYSFDPSLYSAGVLIAGGGNFLEINVRSNYAKWIDALDIDADPSDAEIQRPEKAELRELATLYLAMSKLDSLHTAESMHGVPMLMLHGSNDKAVPASTGDALYEALGRPERWVYPIGHELIFAALPLQTPKIERWIREQVIESDE